MMTLHFRNTQETSGFEKFLATAEEQFEIPPLESITQPSYENRCFREKYMPKDSIALIPPQGYRQTTSMEALGWLDHQKRELGLVKLRHARNSPELVIGGVKVDGCGWDAVGNMYVLQYHGCL